MGQQKYEVMEHQQTFAQFLWNPRTKEFLGRSGTSWGKIFVFYVIFYFFLAGFMALTMFVFLQTIDPKLPTYNPGDGSSILKNPALGFRPLPPPDKIESTLIWFNVDKNKTYEHWTTSLNDFMKVYSDEETKKKYTYITCSDTKKPDVTKGEVCDFDVSTLGPDCNEKNKWGYAKGAPCVILKLNKMIKWLPDLYLNETDLKDKSLKGEVDIKNLIRGSANAKKQFANRIWVTCEGENEPDTEYLGTPKYFPQQGFPAYYYPYMNTDGYLPPVIAVQFNNIKNNVLVNVECKVWAKNIDHVRKTKLGIAHFELLVDKLVE